MKLIDIRRASRSLKDYAEQSQEEPIVVTRNGRPMAAILPIENADLETVSLSTNPEFLAIIERSRRRQEEEGGISSEEMRRRLAVPKPRQKKKPGR